MSIINPPTLWSTIASLLSTPHGCTGEPIPPTSLHTTQVARQFFWHGADRIAGLAVKLPACHATTTSPPSRCRRLQDLD